jgi:hypothetical protein
MRNPDGGGASLSAIGCACAKGESKTACYANAIPCLAGDHTPEAFRNGSHDNVGNAEQLFKIRRLWSRET